VLCWLKNVIRS